MLSCYSILLLGIGHWRKRVGVKICVWEEISFCTLFHGPWKEKGRGHIWMLNCPQKGLIPLFFYRGQFSLPRLPSVLEHQCPPRKLLSLSFPALFHLPREAHHALWCLALAAPSLGCLLSPEHKAPCPAGLLVSY